MSVLLLAGCVALAVASGATAALLRPDSPFDAAVTFGVVAASGVVAVLLVAGLAGLLEPGVALALVALWAAGAVALLARSGRPWPRVPRPRARALLRSPWETSIVVLALLALAWQLLVAVVLPPFAFDALTYHLTTVATWVREGNLDPTPLSLCCARYPADAELQFAWPMLLGGGDALVGTVQVGFAALGALAVAGTARSAGLPAAVALAAGALFAVTPIVLVQAPTGYVDVVVAACALAAMHALVRYAATGAWQRLLVAGLATGLVLGTKGIGALWAIALTVAAIGLAVTARRRRARGGAGALAAFLVACLALGSFWYARNWIETGNPVYPFAVQAAGVHVFDGPLHVDDVLTVSDGPRRPAPVEVARSWAYDLRFWTNDGYDYQERHGGLGPLWWLALPLLAVLAVVLARRRSPVLLVLALTAVVFLLQPYRWWSRFTLVLAACGALAIVAAAAWAPRRWMRVALQAATLVLAVAGVALASREVDPAARAASLPARKVLSLVGAPAADRSLGRLFFGEYRFLDRVPDGATVAVDLRAPAVRFVYPLFGRDLSRRVVPAAASGPPPAGGWVVTGAGRPLDRSLLIDPRFRLVFSERGVRVYAPQP